MNNFSSDDESGSDDEPPISDRMPHTVTMIVSGADVEAGGLGPGVVILEAASVASQLDTSPTSGAYYCNAMNLLFPHSPLTISLLPPQILSIHPPI